jgi:hypothetical protein
MNPRFTKDDTSPYSVDQELREITDRIRKPMEALMPDDWHKARLLIREAEPESDRFVEIAEPLHNTVTCDFIEPLPDEMLQAIEDLYLLFFSTTRHWIKCLIELKRGRSGTWNYSASFAFSRND